MSILEIRHGSKPSCRIGVTLVHGLLTNDKSAWSTRLAEWGNANTYADFSTLKYWEGVFGWGHGSHVRELRDLLRSELAEFTETGQQHAIGHSNGCRLLLECLIENPDLVIDDLHLVAAWAKCDVTKNGILELLKREQVKRIFVYVSKGDDVLGWNCLAPWYWGMELGKKGMGSGLIPRQQFIAATPESVSVFRLMQLDDDGQTHCSWVDPQNGDPGFNLATFDKILSLSAPAAVPA
jgi:hypothetical protein